MEDGAVGDVARERLLGRDRDALASELQLARIDPARPIAQHRPRPCRAAPRAARRRRARRGHRPLSTPAAARRASALGPTPGRRRTGSGARKRGLAPRWDDGYPTGLAAVGGHLADDLRGRDAERARERGRCAHRRLHGLGNGTRAGEVGGDRAQVEVALVDPGSLDARHDLAYAVHTALSTAGTACAGAARRPPRGQRRSASAALIAEWMPNRRAT